VIRANTSAPILDGIANYPIAKIGDLLPWNIGIQA